MKTTTSEVLCDACERPIPAMHPTALFLTLRGPQIGHKKADFHDAHCLAKWAVVFPFRASPVPKTESQ